MIQIRLKEKKWTIEIKEEAWAFDTLEEMQMELNNLLMKKDKFGRIFKNEF